MHFLISAACIPALLLGMVYVRRRGALLRWAWGVAFAGIAASKALELIRVALGNIAHPPLWDFTVFWMVGQLCAAGQNIYDVAAYAPFRALLNPAGDPEFNSIALGIGMPYPPPVAILLYPLGRIADIHAALAVWYAVMFLALALTVAMIWRQFFATDGAGGLVAAAVLVLMLPATEMTVELGQLNFFAVPLLLAIWRARSGWRSGCALAALFVLRPPVIIFALYFGLRHRWGTLSAFAAATGALLLLSLPLVGLRGFGSYLHHNPSQRYPEIYFRGWDSLYKILALDSHDRAAYFSLTGHPLFLLVAGLLLAGAVYVCRAARAGDRNLCLSFLLALALFLYPNTGPHYSLFLLLPMLTLWHERARLKLTDDAVIVLLGLNYALLIFQNGARTTGFVLAFDALVFALIVLRVPPRWPAIVRPAEMLAT